MKPIDPTQEQSAEELDDQALPAVHDPAHFWRNLAAAPLNEKHLRKQRLITLNNTDPAHVAFDILRNAENQVTDTIHTYSKWVAPFVRKGTAVY